MEQLAWYKWQALFADWQVFAQGLGKTVLTSALALLLALLLGVLMGALGTAPWPPVRRISRLYVDLIQNIPLVTQVFFLFYAIGHWGLHPATLWIGVIALGVYHGAYMAEAIRAGIQAIHRGQLEAALSQGFTYSQAMRHIILPQAVRVILPALTNQAVSLIKNSSILAMISGWDLMHQADSWASDTGNYGPAYLVAWALYFALCFPLATWARRLEERAVLPGREVKA